ncbi:hypothetical protein RRG08_003251 [Elysia crispata]|uniref:Uncharacterized protein n=1 Tax=Elysia crispata TaxID=231223 RepID=A0AAE1AYP0_9GAST|nr:hypothetical protein RRG08_003251 [Elysia crispata]
MHSAGFIGENVFMLRRNSSRINVTGVNNVYKIVRLEIEGAEEQTVTIPRADLVDIILVASLGNVSAPLTGAEMEITSCTAPEVLPDSIFVSLSQQGPTPHGGRLPLRFKVLMLLLFRE